MMRLIRWVIVITLVSLHVVMKAPVWHLISRIDLSGGSSSWHRYFLIDTCIRHFGDWWLVGTSSNGDWGWDMWDTANQYVADAYTGGLLGLIFFIAILVYGFKYVARAREAATDKQQEVFFWALGATLFAYTVSFLGISLWDQSVVEWYMLLALIGAVAVPQAQRAKGGIEAAVDRTSGTLADIQPTWLGRNDPQLRDHKSTRDKRLVPLHRRHAREM
jgi:hypothetical protein